jgi:hypothetical protein
MVIDPPLIKIRAAPLKESLLLQHPPTYEKRIEATYTFAPVNSGINGLFT